MQCFLQIIFNFLNTQNNSIKNQSSIQIIYLTLLSMINCSFKFIIVMILVTLHKRNKFNLPKLSKKAQKIEMLKDRMSECVSGH